MGGSPAMGGSPGAFSAVAGNASETDGEADVEAVSWDEGRRLHTQVAAERWCVTRADLQHLRRMVQQAVQDGRIAPTRRDRFDPRDQLVGPSIYTVTEQFIKPVTAKQGGMSWALMRNPEGLDCDLFITHAWMEGVYEFIDKVLNSWPSRSKHAWCCMLAMPQNLDISGLISCPKDSPFAKALACAPWMLVVPNQQGSIYTRLWCVYEAYLGQQQNKIIRTAVAPYWGRAFAHMAYLVLLAVCGVALTSLVTNLGFWEARHDGRIAWFLCPVLMALSLVVNSLRVRLAVNVAGTFIASYTMMRYEPDMWHYVFYFIVAEADRIRALAAKAESLQLLRGYKGSVQYASCAKDADAESICAEIGEQGCKVDQTVDVLIRAKMSTPLLTRLAQAGVEVRDAGHREWAFILMMMILIPIHVMEYFSKHYRGLVYWMMIAECIFKTAWAVLTLCLPPDRQALSMRATAKMVVPYYIFNTGYKLTILLGWTAKDPTYRLVNHSVKLNAWIWAFALTAVPPDVIARIPRVGPKAVQLLIGRGSVVGEVLWLAPPRSRGNSTSSKSSASSASSASSVGSSEVQL